MAQCPRRGQAVQVPTDHFDEKIAERYDLTSASMFTAAAVEPAVDFLAGLVGEGAALELGIGTGRIALPLNQRGVAVHGIDLSPSMIHKLREKPGAESLGVTVGDFATTRLDRSFDLVYLVYNTITNLTTQHEQVACFQNAASHLEPGGMFVVEVFVPTLRQLPPGETVRAFDISTDHLGFDEYDVATQTVRSHHYFVVDGRLEIFSVPFRYVWPAELDLMARFAGMTLSGRWCDWNRGPFTGESTSHVSVWQKSP